jgi:2-polyprenyl-3-methyl-5-hydroxy-6-metoxy-1,4-benzoquinol methylase
MAVPDYFNRVNQDLLAVIPPDARTVLEIGCGAGALCEAYRRINPEVEWCGLDRNAEALAIAEKRGVEIIETDLDEGLPALGWDNDVVILGDILEHCVDPWNVLKWCRIHAAPGAQIIASIPNVQHYTLLYALLTGTFEYMDEGISDRTHLRWFTLDNIRTMFEDAGLQIHEIRGIKGTIGGGPDDGEWAKWVERIGSVPDLDLKRMRALQYLVRAVKPHEAKFDAELRHGTLLSIGGEIPCKPQPLHIHAVTAEGCCARPRILEPFAMLGTMPGVKCTTGHNLDTVNPDIHIQQRAREVDFGLQGILAQHSILIAELDDLPEAIGMDPMCLKAVHAVQVSTEPLAEIVRQYNPNVMVFENQIAKLHPNPNRLRSENPTFLKIFYGAQNRENDWAPIMPALCRVLADHSTIRMIVIHDRQFFDALPEKCDKIFEPFCEYDIYRSILAECDIALLPLEPSRFNECKSSLKFLEAAAEGVVCLASPTVYEHEISHNINGLLYHNAESFERWLRFVIESPNDRRELAERAYTYVHDHRLLGQHCRKRLDWYRSLINARPALQEALLRRCPELARSHEPAPAPLQPVP